MFTACFFWSQVAKQISYGRVNDIKVLLKDKRSIRQTVYILIFRRICLSTDYPYHIKMIFCAEIGYMSGFVQNFERLMI